MQVLLVCLIAGAAAFAPQPASLRSSPRLAGYSEALAEAETASSKFGKESSEAKIACVRRGAPAFVGRGRRSPRAPVL